MRVSNSTSLDTFALRRFLRAGIIANGLDPKGYRVGVVSTRGYFISGYAYFNASWVKLRIPRKVLDLRKLAAVFEHELAHNRGVKHEEMDPETRWCTSDPVWAEDFKPEDFVLHFVSTDPNPEARRAELIETREKKARDALANWLRKQKLAATKVRKYRGVIRGYEKRAAARINTRAESGGRDE